MNMKTLLMSITLVIGSAVAFAGVPAELQAKLSADIDASSKASAKVKTYVKEVLIPLSANPVFVKAVKEQNAKGMTLEQIKKTDQMWIDAEEELAIHKTLMGNACAKEIGKITGKNQGLSEVFVMDHQGANVGQNGLTSDYWQGDEAKFKNAYVKGKGGVDIGKEKLDTSTGVVEQKIGLPIVDENGKVIGAVSWGVLSNKL